MLMYINLYEDKDVEQRYLEAVMSMNVNQFQMYAMHIRDDIL